MKCESPSHLIKQPVQACLVSAELAVLPEVPWHLTHTTDLARRNHPTPAEPPTCTPGTGRPKPQLTWAVRCHSKLGCHALISVPRGYLGLAELPSPVIQALLSGEELRPSSSLHTDCRKEVLLEVSGV